MADTAATSTPKAKAKSAATAATAAMFEMPKFEKFEIPNLDVPAAFREIAEKNLAQANEN